MKSICPDAGQSLVLASEPADGALVLRSYGGRPDVVLVRDDEGAGEWDAKPDERWFTVGDEVSDPLCWTMVAQAAAREDATLALLAPVTSGPESAPKPKPLPAAEQPVGAIVASDVDVYRKNFATGSRPWVSADGYASDAYIDGLLAQGAELLRGEVAR